LWSAAALLIYTVGYPDDGPLSWFITGLIGIGFVPFGGGLLALANSARMWWVLRSHPWVEWDSSYREVPSGVTPNGTPALYLGKDGEHVLTLVAFNWRWDLVRGARTVWLAGSPRRGGVVTTRRRAELIWCRRPRIGAFRNWLRRRR
jgi:hypothetical protein